MKGEQIKTILVPEHKDNWHLIETEKAIYELRLGGYRPTTKTIEYKFYRNVSNIQADEKIAAVYTDDEWLYIKLSSGDFLVYGQGGIDSDGKLFFTMRRFSGADFFENYGFNFLQESDIQEI